MTNNEAKQISLRAAIRERAERLRDLEESAADVWSKHGVARLRLSVAATKSQISDLETELHALIQELPL